MPNMVSEKKGLKTSQRLTSEISYPVPIPRDAAQRLSEQGRRRFLERTWSSATSSQARLTRVLVEPGAASDGKLWPQLCPTL